MQQRQSQSSDGFGGLGCTRGRNRDLTDLIVRPTAQTMRGLQLDGEAQPLSTTPSEDCDVLVILFTLNVEHDLI